jgi:hypothetical protein
MWGLLKANHLDQSLWSTNQKYWAAVKSNLLHSFLEVHNCVVPFTSHGTLHEFGAEKPISWAKRTHFDFFAMNFTIWSHMGGGCVALVMPPPLSPQFLHWISGRSLHSVKPLVEGITKIGPALDYCLVRHYFCNTLDLASALPYT